MRMVIKYWLPVLIWMACIAYFSTDAFSHNHTAGLIEPAIRIVAPNIPEATVKWLHTLIRKMAHVTEYAILSFLVFRALRKDAPVRWTLRWAVITMVVVAGYALSDEWHQSFIPTREASLYDSGLDTAGGLIVQAALAVYYNIRGRGPAIL